MPSVAGVPGGRFDPEVIANVGFALRSLIAPSAPTPAAAPAAPAYTPSAAPAARPTYGGTPIATPDLVRTGDSASPASAGAVPGGFGGSDFQIPDWFQDAARRMFSEQSPDDRMGLPELTLIAAVAAQPVKRLAAAGEGGSPAPAAAHGGGGGEGGDKKGKPDIEALAREVYDAIRIMIEASRERNGDICR
jgi:hypothetical protein